MTFWLSKPFVRLCIRRHHYLVNKCVRAVVDKVSTGGFVYLDDTDCCMTTADSEMRIAERKILEAVRT